MIIFGNDCVPTFRVLSDRRHTILVLVLGKYSHAELSVLIIKTFTVVMIHHAADQDLMIYY